MKKNLIVLVTLALITVVIFGLYNNRNITVNAKAFNSNLKIESKVNDSIYTKVSKIITDYKSNLKLKDNEKIIETKFEFIINDKKVKFDDILKIDAKDIKKIEINAIETVESTTEEIVAYTTEVVENADLFIGEEQISVVGVNGKTSTTIQTVFKNGKQFSKNEPIVVTTNPVNEIKLVGTKSQFENPSGVLPPNYYGGGGGSTSGGNSSGGGSSTGGGGSTGGVVTPPPTTKVGQFPDYASCGAYIDSKPAGMWSCDPAWNGYEFDGSYNATQLH